MVKILALLENIIILQYDNHLAFGRMDLWFTADYVPSLDFHPHIYS
jgi:hypothetical protein